MKTAIVILLAIASMGAGYRTDNFTVSAPTAALAQEIGQQAEKSRKEMAILWVGSEFPKWSKPCPIVAKVAPNLGAGGETSFIFDRGEVHGWKMNIQGSRERILDSVLPHEVTHTVFASYFRQPLPRWADEGACTTVECASEVAKQDRNLIQFLKSGRGIRFNQMFAMKEYPSDVMPLYAQGYSLSKWLIEKHGRRAFLDFIGDGLTDDNWSRAVEKTYGYKTLLELQLDWNDSVRSQQLVATNYGPCGQCSGGNCSNGSCGQGDCGPGAYYSVPSSYYAQPQPARPQVQQPAQVRPPQTQVAGPAGPPRPQGPVGPPGSAASCPCGPKWTEINARITTIENEMKDGKVAITNVVGVVNELKDRKPKPATLNFIGADGKVVATAIVTPGAATDITLPPINFRVQDQRGAGFSTDYQPARLGSFVTLPFGPAKNP